MNTTFSQAVFMQKPYNVIRSTLLLVMASLLLVMSNIVVAKQKDISAETFLKIPLQERILLDVRTQGEYEAGYIPTAINMPVAELADKMQSLGDKDQQIIVYCRSGVRAGRAIEFLSSQGFTNLLHLEGDFGEWSKQGRATEIPSSK